MNNYSDSLIYGKNSLENIVCIEPKDNAVEVFTEKDDVVSSQFLPHKYWALSPSKLDSSFVRLDGNLHYKYGRQWDSLEKFNIFKKWSYKKDIFLIHDVKEACMVKDGLTYFKGMKPQEPSILSFDIETTGLKHDDTSKVLIIANTFRRNGIVRRKLFCYDEFQTEKEMLDAWCVWVRKVNPSIITGHNIISFDFPYLQYIADRCNVTLNLGRNNSAIIFNTKPSKFRVDGSRDQLYHRIRIYGRELIDTYFLAIKYDISKKYETYKLKSIVSQEGLEVKNRQFYDANKIKDNYTNPVEFEKIKRYAMNDGDDALAIYDLMSPSLFYFCQSVPKSWGSMIETASGSQLNAVMMRSYLQEKHSLPKQTEVIPFQGALSMGIPGKYKNVLKVDLRSQYPSIILEYGIYDRLKDPKANFLKMVDTYTQERFKNKDLAEKTNEQYYKDLEQSQKVAINSCYGLLGATGLLFNSPTNAELITKKGREIISDCVYWATNKTVDYWQTLNATT